MENKYSNKYLIETAIGLQDVDGLKNSSYFLSQADRYVKGEISLEELDKIVSSYYENKPKDDEIIKHLGQLDDVTKLMSTMKQNTLNIDLFKPLKDKYIYRGKSNG